jgi:hypothetical protein
MGKISTYECAFSFETEEDAIEMLQGLSQGLNEAWVYDESPYPCMAICLNGKRAAITFFRNEEGEMWLSYDPDNQEPVEFTAGGEEWKPASDVVISFEDMLHCVREFLRSGERPTCIQWQDL